MHAISGIDMNKFNKNSLKQFLSNFIQQNQHQLTTIDLYPLYKKYILDNPPFIKLDNSMNLDDRIIHNNPKDTDDLLDVNINS